MSESDEDYKYADKESIEYAASIQYQNQFDQQLSRECHRGYGMYKVSSVHDNHREDRVWSWECRKLPIHGYVHCTLTGYVNNFDEPMNFMCGRNQYIAGVYSYHDNGREDRRWRFSCCSVQNYITKSCYQSNYVNNFDAPINYQAHGPDEVFTGVYSYHSNHHE